MNSKKSKVSREDRRKQNEKFFQDINNRLHESFNENTNSFAQRILSGHFICECSDMDCTETVSITPNQYDEIAKADNRYVVIQGHEQPEIEDIVEKNVDGGVYIVEKK